jgi:hypothetical protein
MPRCVFFEFMLGGAFASAQTWTNSQGKPIEPVPSSAAPAPKASQPAGIFTLRTVSIMDSPQHIGGEAYRILMPSNWQLDGDIVWRNDPANPASPRVRLRGDPRARK